MNYYLNKNFLNLTLVLSLALVSCAKIMNQATVPSLNITSNPQALSQDPDGNYVVSFPTTAVGVTTSTRLMVQNTGVVAITIDSISFQSGAAFTIVSGGNTTIPALSSASFPITFSPNQVTSLSDVLVISYSNSLETFQTEVGVTGAGTPPANDNCSEVAGAQTNTPFAWGEGTSTSPYVICSPSQYNNIAANPAYLGQYFKLGANLDFTAYNGSTPSTTFQPIGTSAAPFTGVLDGNGYTISNLTYDNPNWTNPLGLISTTSGATIENLILVNVNFKAVAGNPGTALLVGTAKNTLFNNCNIQGSLSPSASSTSASRIVNLGAIAAILNETGSGTGSTLTNLTVNVQVNGSDTLGGVIASATLQNGATVSINNVTVSGAVNQASGLAAGNTFAGLIGITIIETGSTLNVTNAAVSTNINTYGSFGGGFIGTAELSSVSFLTLSHTSYTGEFATAGAGATPNHQGGQSGGMFGVLDITDSQATIETSYVTGSVTNNCPSAFSFEGDFIGYVELATHGTLSISNSYATGNMVGPNSHGAEISAFFGEIYNDGTYQAANLTLTNIYSSGTVTTLAGSTNTGGIGGSLPASFTGSGIYYNSTTNSRGVGVGATTGVNGIATPAFLDQNTFTGWNFSTIWGIVSGSSPYLQ